MEKKWGYGSFTVSGRRILIEYWQLSDSLRWNITKGWYEILSGNVWLKIPAMYRSTLKTLLADLEDKPSRRNPFDR